MKDQFDLLTCTNNELMDISHMADMLLERCRNSSWVIVSKALVTLHSVLSNGNDRFFQQLAAKTSLWELENFQAAMTGYDMSSFIQRYAKYLTQKVQSYRGMNYDFCRAKRGADGELRTLDTDKLLKALAEIQTLIDSLLDVDLQSSEFSNGVINSAFVLLFKDLIKLFACYNDGMISLLEKYYDMNKENCKESLTIYKQFLRKTDEVQKFLTVAQEIGVSEDAIPDLAKAPSGLLESLENHYKSLEKGQVTAASETKPLNLAPITISLKSEQFNFKEEEVTGQFSPEENNNDATNGQPTLLERTETTNSGSQAPWQNLFEPELPQPNKIPGPSNQQNDLLELQAVFQAQQAPQINSFPPSSNLGAPAFSAGINQSSNQSSNPFETRSVQISSDILQPMNKPQTISASHQQVQPQRQVSTGDLHSSLSKVAQSLDNLDLMSAPLDSGSTGHQWTARKPKIKTGGANFQMGTTAGSTLVPGNPVSPALPYNVPQSTISPINQGMGQPQPVLGAGYRQPSMSGPRPMAYGQQPMTRPQATMFPAPRANANPFGDPVPRNQALF